MTVNEAEFRMRTRVLTESMKEEGKEQWEIQIWPVTEDGCNKIIIVCKFVGINKRFRSAVPDVA
jgi:hypothetical protein